MGQISVTMGRVKLCAPPPPRSVCAALAGICRSKPLAFDRSEPPPLRSLPVGAAAPPLADAAGRPGSSCERRCDRSICLDKNRREVVKSQPIWTDSKTALNIS
jgi:hypothetical protein